MVFIEDLFHVSAQAALLIYHVVGNEPWKQHNLGLCRAVVSSLCVWNATPSQGLGLGLVILNLHSFLCLIINCVCILYLCSL